MAILGRTVAALFRNSFIFPSGVPPYSCRRTGNGSLHERDQAMKRILASVLFVGLGMVMAGGAMAEPPEGGPPEGPPPRERGPDGPPRPPGPPHGPFGGPIMMALDADKDGALSAEEIAKAPEALKTLDKNGDGKLTVDELGPPRPPRGPRGPGDFERGPRGEGPPEFGRRPRGEAPPDADRPPRRGRPEDLERERERRGRRDFGPPGPPEGRGFDAPGPPDERGPRRGPPAGEARGPRVLPPGARERLELNEEQTAKIDALEKDVQTKLEEILKPEQLERLAEIFRRGPGRPGGPPPGEGRFRGRPDGPPGPPE